MKAKLMLLVLFAVASAAAGAQDRVLADAQENDEYYPWRAVTVDMSADEYRQACRENRRFLRHVVRSQVTAALVSLEIPASGIRMLGAVAALAADQDARLHLNRSKTLALHLTDVVDEKRALQLGFKLKW